MKVGRTVSWTAGILLLALSGCLSRVTISYSAICPNCLQYAHGVRKKVFGITYYHSRRPSQRSHGIASPDAFTDRIPPVDPARYREIFGKSCRHEYRQLGFCRYSFNLVACGGGGSLRYDPKVQAIENIYRAYEQFKDAGLARLSFAEVSKLDSAQRHEELRGFAETMQLLTSKQQWEDALRSSKAIGR
jgi:hypothetical protein